MPWAIDPAATADADASSDTLFRIASAKMGLSSMPATNSTHRARKGGAVSHDTDGAHTVGWVDGDVQAHRAGVERTAKQNPPDPPGSRSLSSRQGLVSYHDGPTGKKLDQLLRAHRRRR